MADLIKKASQEITSATALLSSLYNVGVEMRESRGGRDDFNEVSLEIIALVGRRLDIVSSSLTGDRTGCFDENVVAGNGDAGAIGRRYGAF